VQPLRSHLTKAAPSRSNDVDAPHPSTQAVEIRQIIKPLAREWDLLADRTHAAPFLRPGWFEAWWKAFGSGVLEITTVRRDGRLSGVLPLYHRAGVLRSLSNWHTPAFGILADSMAAQRELAQSIFSRRHRRVSFGFLDSERPDVARVRAAAEAAHRRVLERALERSPYVRIDQDWAAYEQALSTNVRGDLGRRLRRLSEQGRVSFETWDGSERLDELLDEGFRTEALGWKGEHNTAILSRPHTHCFYREVAAWAAERGWLRLAFLRLNERAVGFLYSLISGGVHYPLKGGYDPVYARFSPGRLIVHWALQRAFSEGLTRFEFLPGGEPYKLAWANACRDVTLLQAFSRSPLGLVDWAAFAYGRPLAKRAGLQRVLRAFPQ
jgi:CelD/BcsL family acetyltransferase involved in cellulose biosynthesis